MKHSIPADGGQESPEKLPTTLDVLRQIFEAHRLPTSQKCVLLCLASHANRSRGWLAFPDRDTISDETGLSKSAISAALKPLEMAGYLTVERRQLSRKVNHYYLNLEAIFPAKSSGIALSDPSASFSAMPRDRSPRSVGIAQSDTNREPTTEKREQRSKSMSTSTSVAPIGAPSQATADAPRTPRKRPPESVQLSVAETKRIVNSIPQRLYRTLLRLYVYTVVDGKPTEEQEAKFTAAFLRKVSATIRFRGIPQDPDWEGYSEQDWTQVFWYATKRTLDGRWQEEFEKIRDPAAYLNEVADHAHWADDAGDYSEQALDAAIAAHNREA